MYSANVVELYNIRDLAYFDEIEEELIEPSEIALFDSANNLKAQALKGD